jgi:hypothetical protein
MKEKREGYRVCAGEDFISYMTIWYWEGDRALNLTLEWPARVARPTVYVSKW